MTLTPLLEQGKDQGKRIRRLEEVDVVLVAARYNTNAGQSITDRTLTIIDYEDVDYDTRDAVTTGSSWAFTAPVGGYYIVNAKVHFIDSGAWQIGEALNLLIYVNGTAHSRIGYGENFNSTTTIQAAVNGSDIVYLQKDDALDIRVYQETGGTPRVLSSDPLNNYVSIARIK